MKECVRISTWEGGSEGVLVVELVDVTDSVREGVSEDGIHAVEEGIGAGPESLINQGHLIETSQIAY